MKINELILNEAISLTKYEDAFRNAIYNGITESIVYIGNSLPNLLKNPFFVDMRNDILRGGWRLDTGVTSLVDSLTKSIKPVLQINLTKNIKQTADNMLGANTVSTFTFQPNGGFGGSAQGQNIFINTATTTDLLSQLIMDMIKESAIHNVPAQSNAFDNIFHVMSNTSSLSTNADIAKIVDDILDIIIHEVLHVMQNKQKFDVGRKTTAYKSYLSKTPSELSNLNRGFNQGKLTPSETQRFLQLYHASPQEMGAYAHNIALNIIRNYKAAPAATTLDDLPSARDLITDINSHVSKYIQPTTIKQQRVYNRYIKLVYQEVDRYLDHLREKIKGETS